MGQYRRRQPFKYPCSNAPRSPPASFVIYQCFDWTSLAIRALLFVSRKSAATRRPATEAIRGSGQWKRWIFQRQAGEPKMSSSKPKTKSAKVIAMLNRGKGASINEIGKATKWKPHSVRAFMTGLRKKGYAIVREQRSDDGTVCRITEQPEASAS